MYAARMSPLTSGGTAEAEDVPIHNAYSMYIPKCPRVYLLFGPALLIANHLQAEAAMQAMMVVEAAIEVAKAGKVGHLAALGPRLHLHWLAV
jgi:hypothetical protein